MVIPVLGLLVFGLQIYCGIDCYKSNMETNKKLLWILVIILGSLIGCILYFLLAKKQS
jgi:hypothetical protein